MFFLKIIFNCQFEFSSDLVFHCLSGRIAGLQGYSIKYNRASFAYRQVSVANGAQCSGRATNQKSSPRTDWHVGGCSHGNATGQSRVLDMDLGTKKKLLDDERHYIKDILKNKIKVIKVTTIAKKVITYRFEILILLTTLYHDFFKSYS